MHEYFFTEFIDFMFFYANLFSPNDYEKDDKIILKYFK